MMLKDCLEDLKKRKIIKNKDYYLFVFGDELFFHKGKNINKDKMELAVLRNQRPKLFSDSSMWFDTDWEVVENE